MKILFVLDEFLPENNGGAANVAFWLAKGLIGAGHDLLILTATYKEENVGYTEIEKVPIQRILTRPFGKFRNWKNLNNYRLLTKAAVIIKTFQPDIVHVHSCHHRFSYGVIDLAKQFSKAVFMTLHDAQTIYNGKLYQNHRVTWLNRLRRDGLTFNPLQSFLIRRALKKTDKIFAVSKELKSTLIFNGISNIEVIQNGIDARGWIVSELHGKNILFAGRVDEAKGVRVLIDAFDLINSEIPNAKLIIVGDGDFKAKANTNIKILSWQSREEMKKLFSQAVVVVVPSLYLDPFPTVNLEAMAAGKPVVGTCFGGTPEAIVNNETGYIVNPYDKKDLADKIIDLLKNPEKAMAFGRAGRKRVEEFFSIDEQVQRTLRWYNKFI